MKTGTEKKASVYTALIFVFFPLQLSAQEFIFHINVIGPAGTKIIYPLSFAFCTGCLLSMIFSAIKPKILRFVTGAVLSLFFTLFFMVHVVYHSVFVTYWAPFSTLSVAGQAFDYGGMIHDNALANNTTLMLLALPFLLYLIFGIIIRKIPSGKAVVPSFIGLLITAALFFALILNDKEAYECAHAQNGLDEGMATTGALCSSIADGLFAAKGGELTITVPASDPAPDSASARIPVPSPAGVPAASMNTADPAPEDTPPEETFTPIPQIMDIDLNSLAEAESNNNIKNMHLYFSAQEPSYTNKYTGIFEGYNLIWITVEGMCRYIIDEERTPTLYKLSHEGFDFTHYYTPLWYGSTSGGEWAVLTGMPPGNGGYIAMEHTGTAKTNMYFTPSERLGALGYDCYGFHANYADYYGRNKSHTNMGLKWIAYGTGYKGELWGNGKLIWPQSDLNLWNESKDYLDLSRPFYAYYMTISGHAQYNWGGNAMAARHKELFDSLPYEDKTKAYLSCEYEVELMLTQMLKDLEDAGILDKTVIVLTADHIPYNDMEICDDIAGYELEKEFEQYENSLIIWSGAMKEPVAVDKYCSSIDILPTVLNLFGIEYDSRLMAGRDILSDSPQLVMFNGSKSFISDKCMYNAKDGSITPFAPYTEEDISKEYILSIQEEIKNKARLASLIIDNNYYDKLNLPLVPVDALEGSD